ncbi:hypothetical protein [Streptomyces sp. NPDC059389]|uniref:hypothetical protein n=1 Tax=Streptomyces sp. NPDC059389 TaxID=3346818 RepID=UPI0036C49C2C
MLVDLSTDELFRKPTLAFAEERAARGRPVWTYEFAFPTPAHDGRLGAPHCLDTRTGDGLARTGHAAWIAFVRAGDPDHPAMPH